MGEKIFKKQIKELSNRINAVMHRDYQFHTPIRLYQFDDRIEILNAGGLYGNARPENFPNVNDYRNPVIAEAMKVLGYVNRFSRGVSRVNEELFENGNGKAVFNFNLLTVFEVFVKVSVKYNEQVTTQVTILLQKLKGEMSRQELQEKVGLSNKEHFRKHYLKPALEQGFIEMTIPNNPNSSLQRYRLTGIGKKWKQQLQNKEL